MRKFTLLAVVSLVVFFNTNIIAQNSDHRWALGVYVNWLDFNLEIHHIKIPTVKDWSGKHQMIPSKFSLGRFISPSFNVVGTFSTNKLDIQRTNDYEFVWKKISTDKFWDADVSIAYKFANGYILKESSWFAPYVYTGVGLTNVDNITYTKQVSGLGIDFWVLPYLSLNVHGSANLLVHRDNALQLGTGFKLRFGGGKDTDQDGISDKKDLCPTEFGLKELSGCPDKDGDGIADKDDACPDVAGPKELKGCPDTDGDGILDKDDRCPDEKGTKALNGCPDKDGDGVIDKDDQCPDVAGLAKFAGCPDRDGDGIPDKDDKCPDVAGTASNNGCPEVKTEVVKAPEINQVIYFSTGIAAFKAIYTKDLDEVITYLKDNAAANLNIDGHADEVGSISLNMRLSDHRAANVIKYLTGKGISADRLIKTAYGKSRPAADNKTAAGRTLNRRVEIRTTK
jgi:OmpA-OmpF porin, OOP family